MTVATNPVLLLADDQTGFAVGLVADQAVDHMRTDLFQGARPGDIGFFVKTGTQLDQNRDFLAGFGGLGQRSGNG